MKFKDVQPGIHEVNDPMFKEEDGQRALWVHGNIYDSTVDALKAKGLQYDQKLIKLYIIKTQPSHQVG